MSPHNEIFHAIPFDASSDANESLIASGDAEDEDHRIEEKAFARFKLSSLVLGLLVGFSGPGADFLVITIWGDEVVTKSQTDIVVFSLMRSFFTSAMAIVILRFRRNLLTVLYSAVAGRSQDLLEEIVLHMECRFVVGALIGVCLAWTMTAIILGMRAQIVNSLATLVVALFWCKIMMVCFAYSDAKPSSRAE
jgi:hypothetical protein